MNQLFLITFVSLLVSSLYLFQFFRNSESLTDSIQRSLYYLCSNGEKAVLKPFNLTSRLAWLMLFVVIVLLYILPPGPYNANKKKKLLGRSIVVGSILYFYITLIIVLTMVLFFC